MKKALFISTFVISDGHSQEGGHVHYHAGQSTSDPDKGCKSNPDNWTFVCEVEIEIDQPEFDVRPFAVASLTSELQELRAQFSVKEQLIERRIGDLLAITDQGEPHEG